MNIDIEINKDWFEKNKAKFLENFNDEYRQEEKGKVYKLNIEGKNNEYTISENGEFNIVVGSDEVFICGSEKPDIESVINLSQIVAKFYNKAKTALEALK